ncbi:MAG: hypothetical protein ABI342_02440 [Nitrososphaera sp.]
MQKIGLLVATIFLCTLVIDDAFATQIQIVTDNGNVFTVQRTINSTTSTSSTSGSGNGLGTGAQIVTIKPQGTIIAGIDNVVGQPYSLVPYNRITSGTFAAGFQKSDDIVKLIVPKMNSQYIYSNGVLIPNPAPQSNILAPVATTVLAGSGSTTTSSSGMTFTGTGSTILVKANGAGSSVVEGTGITGGGLVIFGTPIDFSVSIVAYDPTHGPGVFTSSATSSSTYSVTIQDSPYWCCDTRSGRMYYPSHVETHYAVTVPVNKYVSSSSNAFAIYDWSYYTPARSGFACSGGWAHRGCSYYTIPSVSSYGPASAVINGYQSGNKYYVQSLTYDTTNNLATSNPKFTLYDKSPFDPATAKTFTSDFTSQVNFSPTPYWFLVQPTSGGTTIKASAYDPATQLFLQVTGLPANVPYQILENGIIGLQGITGSDGTLRLSAAQMVAGGQSLSGELDIYPNSPTYVGNIGTVVYDSVNNKMFNIPSGTPLLYTPFAYVQIPMPTTSNISNVLVNGYATTQLYYLSKSYASGSSMMVPIVPGLKTISFNINGSPITINLSTVMASTGISIVTPGTSSNSAYSTTGSSVTVSANTGGEAVAIAPKDGIMFALINSQVSADTSFTTSAAYNYQNTQTQYIYGVYNYKTGLYVPSTCSQWQFQEYGCTDNISVAPSTSARAGPLTVYVDTYVNGVLTNSQIVYHNNQPQIQQSTTVSGYNVGGSSAMSMHYASSSASGLVQTQVHAGDLVEFYLRAHVDAYADPIPVPRGMFGVFTTTSQSSVGSATINLSSGSILTGIS